MSEPHTAIIRLIMAYTLVGAFIFTVAITCLSLVGWVRFADRKQQKRLFLVLIIQLVVIGLGSFRNLLRFNPGSVAEEIGFEAMGNVRSDAIPLMGKVATLSDQRAIKLAAKSPTSSPEIEQLIRAVDPENLRASDPAAAKKTLKMRIGYKGLQPEELTVWAAALAEDSGADEPIKPMR